MLKKIYPIAIFFIYLSGCVNINTLAHTGELFIRAAFSGNREQVRTMLFSNSERDIKDAVSFFQSLNQQNTQNTVITHTGYRVILYQKREIHSLWYSIQTGTKRVIAALLFVKNNGWKVISYQIGNPPDDW